jgi:hypothetical protein
MKQDTLTDDQRKVVEQVGDELERAVGAAHDKLVAAGFDPDSTACAVPNCSCGGYRSGGGAGCKNRGCGHSIMEHDNMT